MAHTTTPTPTGAPTTITAAALRLTPLPASPPPALAAPAATRVAASNGVGSDEGLDAAEGT